MRYKRNKYRVRCYYEGCSEGHGSTKEEAIADAQNNIPPGAAAKVQFVFRDDVQKDEEKITRRGIDFEAYESIAMDCNITIKYDPPESYSVGLIHSWRRYFRNNNLSFSIEFF